MIGAESSQPKGLVPSGCFSCPEDQEHPTTTTTTLPAWKRRRTEKCDHDHNVDHDQDKGDNDDDVLPGLVPESEVELEIKEEDNDDEDCPGVGAETRLALTELKRRRRSLLEESQPGVAQLPAEHMDKDIQNLTDLGTELLRIQKARNR